MKTFRFLTGMCFALLCCSRTTAQHAHVGDFELKLEFDSIVVEPRVLPAELHREEFLSTDEPGFDSEPGTFPPGTAIGFNIVDGLKRWTGDRYEPLLTGTHETIIVSFLQQISQTDSGFVAGFDLPLTDDHSWHRHFMFTLTSPGPDVPRAGIYLLALELYCTSPLVKGSYPVYVVFNIESEADHERAIEWVHHNLAGPVCMQKPVADLNDDCAVDFQDFALFADSWLSCNLRPLSGCWQ